MEKYKIYKLWWQGLDNAPEIVKICHESLLRNYNPKTQEIIFLDKKNLFDYVNLPDYIMKKFEDNIISRTHFSDIVRSNLLNNSGGMWVDATMFFAKNIPDSLFQKDFFTLKNPIANSNNISSKWECFFISGEKKFPLFGLLQDMWYKYWDKEDDLITYLLTDHIFYIGYKENIRIRNSLDKCPSFFYPIDYFQKLLNSTYDENKYNEIVANEPFIKLTYKSQLIKKDNNGCDTYYGKLVKDYL